MDISCLPFNLSGKRHLFDAIVCDPPYGVRARSQKTGIKEGWITTAEKAEKKELATGEHFAMKEHYDFVELHLHLIDVASQLLKPGGRLVYLFHTDDREPDEKNTFPEHPSFIFVRSSRDILTKNRARHLITMEKKMTMNSH
jgi:tRNA (guanine10-N2)-methyltransferase